MTRGPRRTVRLALAALLCAAGVAAPARAASAQDTTRARAAGQGVEFDFQDTELRVVLAALAEAAGLNVLLSEIPARTVSLRTSRPIPRAEARAYFDSFVRSQALTVTEEGGLVRVAGTAGAAAAQPPQPAPGAAAAAAARRVQDPVRLFVHRLDHGDAEAMAQTLQTLFGLGSGGGGGGGQRGESLSDQLAAQRLDPFVPPEPAPAAPTPAAPQSADAATGLGTGLTGPVQIVPDPRTNSLLIRSGTADFATIRGAIEQLDVRPVQVLIEVLIAEVRYDNQLGLGVSAKVPDQRVTIDGKQGPIIGGELLGAATGDVVLRVLRAGGVQADVVLSALAASSDVTILSRPIVLARNNEEARILVGSERPFVQIFRALPTDGAVRDQIVQYRDVGTSLTIRPTVNPDGYVSMSVLQEVSNATAETQFGAPVISTREARTALMVRDGATAVLGGLIDQQRETSNSGVPFLKDIPILGWLFRSTSVRRTTTELFLFLTPHVLASDEDMEEATQRLRDGTGRLKDRVQGPIPLLPGTPPDSTR